MRLQHLLQGLADCTADTEINDLSLDSRKIKPGDAFFALSGAHQHGLNYAGQAIANGASAVIYDPADVDLSKIADMGQVPKAAIPNLDEHLGYIAAKFYGDPSRHLDVIGITGTNGKTTCSQLIAQALPDSGVIGTLGWGETDHLVMTNNTTPDALTIQQILKQFLEQKKSVVAMEVSSHGLQQGRVNAVAFKGAVFTNLSHDHLDYHQSMAEYLQAKLVLFKNPALGFAVVNLDDPYASAVIDTLADHVQLWTFSTQGKTVNGAESILATESHHSLKGSRFLITWRSHCAQAFTSLAGFFNIENVLAVEAVLLAMGLPFDLSIARLADLKAITGRMEKFGGVDKPLVFVDYAHTPDALAKALNAAKVSGKLWVVFGCGGDRDKAKRREMGKIATTWADQIIITDDNPRSEPPMSIINDILAGCQNKNVCVINDRTLAIQAAIQKAAKNDCVIIAGKGHENYQEIAGRKLPFSDQEVVKQSLAVWVEMK